MNFRDIVEKIMEAGARFTVFGSGLRCKSGERSPGVQG